MNSKNILSSILSIATLTASSVFAVDQQEFESISGASASATTFLTSPYTADLLPELAYSVHTIEGKVYLTKLEPKLSSYDSFVQFFHTIPVTGETIIVNSQPRLVLSVNEETRNLVFSDVSWDFVKPVSF